MHIGVRIKLGWSSKLTKLEVDFFTTIGPSFEKSDSIYTNPILISNSC